MTSGKNVDNWETYLNLSVAITTHQLFSQFCGPDFMI